MIGFYTDGSAKLSTTPSPPKSLLSCMAPIPGQDTTAEFVRDIERAVDEFRS
jgi:hypothetical protein